MTTLGEIVDVEALVVAILKADAGLGALVGGPGAGALVSTELPRDFAPAARVQLTRTGGAEVDATTHYLDRAILQLKAFGTNKAQAWDVMAATFVALAAAPGAYDGAVITAVSRVTGPMWGPDTTNHPPAPRYLATVAVHVHPS